MNADPICQIKLVERDDAVVLVVEGELDLSTAPLLAERLTAAEATDAPLVIVDLDRVSFMDSSALHVLVSHALTNGGHERVRLTRGSRQVRRVFEVVGMFDRLPFICA